MTKIEWTHVPDGQGDFKKGETWNPQVGCVEVSPACRHCYAASTAHLHAKTVPQHAGLTVVRSNGVHWNGEINRVPKLLEKPLRWREPRGIFVGSMTDTFLRVDTDEDCEFIAALFGVMAATPHHTYMLLTKRPENAAKWFAWLDKQVEAMGPHSTHHDYVIATAVEHMQKAGASERILDRCANYSAAPGEEDPFIKDFEEWPLPNVWMMVTAEDQQRADERIPALLQLPAAVRGVSYEPACGPVDFSPWLRGVRIAEQGWDVWELQRDEPEVYRDSAPLFDTQEEARKWADAQGFEFGYYIEQTDEDDLHPDHLVNLDWIIAGGESGHGARPAHPDWFRSARYQCVAVGVAFFFKQWGEWAPHGDGWTHVVFSDGKLDTWEAAYSETAAEDRGMLEATLADCDGAMIKRVGKAAAGRELDGETWSQFPTDARP